MQRGRYILVFLSVIGCLFPLATALLGHSELEEQIAALTTRIEQDPTNAALYLRRGDLHRIHQEWLRAVTDFARVEKLAPELAAVDLLRGQMLVEAGQAQCALTPLDRFLKRVPDNSDGHAWRARALLALDKKEEAILAYNAAVTNATLAAVDLYSERAQLLISLGHDRLDEAVRGLDEGVKRLGQAGALAQQAINIRITQRRYDDALARLDTLRAGEARQETFLLQRSQILQQAGRLDEARQSCRQALVGLDILPIYRRRVQATLDLEQNIKTTLQRLEQQKATECTYANH